LRKKSELLNNLLLLLFTSSAHGGSHPSTCWRVHHPAWCSASNGGLLHQRSNLLLL
jgi:hypothetical protein